MDGLVEKSKKEKNSFSSSESQGLIKRRQFSQYGAAQIGGMPEMPTGIGQFKIREKVYNTSHS
ncbi:unnamed protein product [Meloidogyne enterolobii]|uniref:Uncharacterized protein n=1 Tax=Meloidogyne enterolobii TaxID=390850 RepID=A0ACB0ZSK3_MELEN